MVKKAMKAAPKKPMKKKDESSAPDSMDTESETTTSEESQNVPAKPTMPKTHPVFALAKTNLDELQKKWGAFSLEEKVNSYSDIVKKILDKSESVVLQDSQQLLRSFFTPNEMSALWGQMKRTVNKSGSAAFKAEHNTISKLGVRQGKQQKLNLMLNMFLKDRLNFESAAVHALRQVSRVDTHLTIGTWMYRAELKQALGAETATAYIDKGKYEKDVDSDGDSIFKKRVKSHTKSDEQRDTVKVKKKRSVDQDEAAEIEARLGEVCSEASQRAQAQGQLKTMKKMKIENDALAVASLAGGDSSKTTKSGASAMLRMLTDIAAKVMTSHAAIKKEKLASQIAKELAASGRELEHMRKVLQTAITRKIIEENM